MDAHAVGCINRVSINYKKGLDCLRASHCTSAPALGTCTGKPPPYRTTSNEIMRDDIARELPQKDVTDRLHLPAKNVYHTHDVWFIPISTMSNGSIGDFALATPML